MMECIMCQHKGELGHATGAVKTLDGLLSDLNVDREVSVIRSM